ncbi:MAG: carbon-nitrogen hydrolase family protein [Firmicutes bacterium]|nr:carbon-nitrogen hydrolase family protein [Bacillota bacterium]
MRIAQMQTRVYQYKEQNLTELEKNLEKISGQGVDLVCLGEMFCCPYETPNFPVYGEPEGGEIWQRLSESARRYGIYLSAGSVPETTEDGKVYNTAYVFDRQGKQIGKHRKVHLFDIDVKGGQRFKESDTLTAGDWCTVFDTEFGKIGLCICFDFRFPELARLMVLEGAKLILIPAAFNLTTGPAHWEVMFRGRAVDNQCFVAGTSPARDMEASYHAWGHTLLVSPWGDVIEEMDEQEGIIINDIDLEETERIRNQLPLLSARRRDLYQLIKL